MVLHLIASWAPQHTNVMHDRVLNHPPVKDGRVVLWTMGTEVTLGWYLKSGFSKLDEKKITLFKFNYISLIYWTPINKHIFLGRAISREGFLPISLSPSFISLACSLHFIINWHKPFLWSSGAKLRNDSTTNNEQNTKRQWTLFEYSSEPP